MIKKLLILIVLIAGCAPTHKETFMDRYNADPNAFFQAMGFIRNKVQNYDFMQKVQPPREEQ